MDPDAIFDKIRRTFDGVVSITKISDGRMPGRGGYYWMRRDKHHVWINEILFGTARLVALAHELGHYQSALRGRTTEYELAITHERDTWADCPPTQRRAVLDEEVLACQLGLALACEHGLDDATEFLEVMRVDFENYRNKVALPVEEFNDALAKLTLPPP